MNTANVYLVSLAYESMGSGALTDVVLGIAIRTDN